MGRTISLCVITSRKAEIIGRFLDSFKGSFDELCLVSATGNKEPDRSLVIAQEWCDSNNVTCRYDVYLNADDAADWPHVDNFAAARQMAYDMATGDLCMWADTDDLLRDGDAAKIREIADSMTEGQVMLFAYNTGTGGLGFRERLTFNGAGKWVNDLHEVYICDKELERVAHEAVVFLHHPEAGRDCSFDRNQRILDRRLKGIGETMFYKAQDLYLVGRYDDFRKWAFRALPNDMADYFRFEIHMNLAYIADSFEEASEWLHKAIEICPWRREPLAELALRCVQQGQNARGLAYAQQMVNLPFPKIIEPYNVRKHLWGWRGLDIFLQCARAAGRHDLVEKNEERARPHLNIALIHATRGRPKQAMDARTQWLAAASDPLRIEHIFAVDVDDEETLKATANCRRVIVSKPEGCVKAWNLAAVQSSAPVIIQMSDDFTAPQDWDKKILSHIPNTAHEYVVKVSDGIRRDDLMCMAIMTRARYLRFGYMFHPDYLSMYSDNEFTEVASRDGVIIDATDVVFTHRHPLANLAQWDKTYIDSNSDDRYKHGKALFDRRKQQGFPK